MGYIVVSAPAESLCGRGMPAANFKGGKTKKKRNGGGVSWLAGAREVESAAQAASQVRGLVN